MSVRAVCAGWNGSRSGGVCGILARIAPFSLGNRRVTLRHALAVRHSVRIVLGFILARPDWTIREEDPHRREQPGRSQDNELPAWMTQIPRYSVATEVDRRSREIAAPRPG